MPKAYRPWYIIGENNGQVPLKRQLLGLQTIEVKNLTLLDLGCAEGLTSIHMARQGARLVHGVELLDRAVEVGRSLVGFSEMSDRVKFFVGDLRQAEQALTQDGLLPSYDVILAMASIQKLGKKSVPVLRHIASLCNRTLVIRLPKRELPNGFRTTTDPAKILEQQGFKMLWEGCGHPQGEPPYPMEGGSWLAKFDRVAAP